MIDLVARPAAAPAPALAQAWAAMEHDLGVLPLVKTFFAVRGPLADVVAGRVRGALGLFTPAPEPGWGAAAVAAERARGGGLLLRGDVRLVGPSADGAIVLARLPAAPDAPTVKTAEAATTAEHCLVWVGVDAPGVERRGARTGGPIGGGPCWLHLAGAAIDAELVSRPVTLAPDGELARLLTAYAGAWARAGASCARDGVRALRRAARMGSAQTSQLVAFGITEVEIEADLALAAAGHFAGSLAAAVAAARVVAAVAAKTAELCDSFGLAIDGPFGPDARDSAATPTAFLGGPLLLESELARALAIGEGGEPGAPGEAAEPREPGEARR